MKGGMALEGPQVGRKEAEADRAAAIAVVDAVDQRRQLLAPVIVGREQFGLMYTRRNEIEQHNADGERGFTLASALCGGRAPPRAFFAQVRQMIAVVRIWS